MKLQNLTSHGLRVGIALAVVLGVLAAFHGQAYGTKVGVPDPVERVVWALIPHALLIVGLIVVARSRIDLVLLLASSLAVWLTSDYSGHDELGLVFVIVPVVQVVFVALVLGVVMIRRLWPRIRNKFGGPHRAAQS